MAVLISPSTLQIANCNMPNANVYRVCVEKLNWNGHAVTRVREIQSALPKNSKMSVRVNALVMIAESLRD